MNKVWRVCPLLPLLLTGPGCGHTPGKVTIGSKKFAESWILGDARSSLQKLVAAVKTIAKPGDSKRSQYDRAGKVEA